MVKIKIKANRYFSIVVAFVVLTMLTAIASAGVGENPGNVPLTKPTLGSLIVKETMTGKLSLSTDGVGTVATTGTIRVNKPAGATVKKAILMSATTGFTNYKLQSGDVLIDGVNVFPWDVETVSSISSWNYWKDVTSLVKTKIDGAPAGVVSFTITESNTYSIDGEALAVVFEDLSLPADNTIVLLFGAQNVLGDNFAVTLSKPVDMTDPNFGLDFLWGVSYGAQTRNCGAAQYSLVDVNSIRLTSSAGGEDDGTCANGALMTVGGIGDSNANPLDPFLTWNGDPRLDDEDYSLLPLINNGDTSISVHTSNPSMDDNIFFAAFDIKGNTGQVNPGIPEFPTIAMPVIAVMGMLFLFQRRKGK